MNPFGNPFEEMGLYDSSDPLKKWSRGVGTVTASAEAVLGAYAVLDAVWTATALEGATVPFTEVLQFAVVLPVLGLAAGGVWAADAYTCGMVWAAINPEMVVIGGDIVFHIVVEVGTHH